MLVAQRFSNRDITVAVCAINTFLGNLSILVQTRMPHPYAHKKFSQTSMQTAYGSNLLSTLWTARYRYTGVTGTGVHLFHTLIYLMGR